MPKAFVYLLPFMPGWRTMKALAPTLSYDMLLTCDVPPLDRVSKISMPTKIIFGEKNPVSILSVAEQLSRAIPGAELTRLDGQDHMASAKVVLPVLTGFLMGKPLV